MLSWGWGWRLHWPGWRLQHMQLPMRCLHLVCVAAGAPARAQAPAACCWHRLPRRPPFLAQVRMRPTSQPVLAPCVPAAAKQAFIWTTVTFGPAPLITPAGCSRWSRPTTAPCAGCTPPVKSSCACICWVRSCAALTEPSPAAAPSQHASWSEGQTEHVVVLLPIVSSQSVCVPLSGSSPLQASGTRA